MSLRRRLAVLVAFALVPALAVLVAAPIVLVDRVRAGVVARCEQRSGGRCSIARVALARDGLVLHDVTVQLPASRLTLSVDAAAVRIPWIALALRRDVAASVDVARLSVHGTTDARALLADLDRLRGAPRSADARAHRVVDRVSVGEITADLVFDDGLAVHLARGSLDWSPDVLDARWPDARVSLGEGFAASSGSCLVVRTSATHRSTVDCTGSEVRVDSSVESVERLRRLHDTLDAAWHRGPGARSGATEADAAHRDQERDAPESVLALHDGTVVWSRGATLLARLTPATLTARLAGTSLREVHAGIGREGLASAPVIEALYRSTAGDPWQLDVDAATLPLSEIARLAPSVPWHDVARGLAFVHVHAEPEHSGGAVMVDGTLELQHFGVAHARLAHDPIDDLSFRVHGAARVDRARHRVETDGLELALNGLSLGVSGWLEHRDGRTSLDLHTRVPTTPCDAPRRLLPPSVVGPVTGLELGGTISADTHLALDTANLDATVLEMTVDDACAIANDGLVQGIRRLGRPFVQRVQEPQGLRAFVTGPGSAAWVPAPLIAPVMLEAVVGHEDGRFYRHAGFDLTEIRGAIIRDLAAGRFVYGASTLSMQLAKNIFLQREKTLVRKLQEVVFTWYLEHVLGKEAIVELYLNVVEFGPGIYGIGPASRFFFDREPRDLTPLQSLYLATLLPAPVARFGNFQRGSVSEETLARLRAQARGMAARGLITAVEGEAAQTETLAFRAANAPTHGPLTENVDAATADESLAMVARIDDAIVTEDVVEGAGSIPPVEELPAEPSANGDVRRASVRIPPSPY